MFTLANAVVSCIPVCFKRVPQAKVQPASLHYSWADTLTCLAEIPIVFTFGGTSDVAREGACSFLCGSVSATSRAAG